MSLSRLELARKLAASVPGLGQEEEVILFSVRMKFIARLGVASSSLRKNVFGVLMKAHPNVRYVVYSRKNGKFCTYDVRDDLITSGKVVDEKRSEYDWDPNPNRTDKNKIKELFE